jgi:beta-galactosidase/beta-glucuronidase
VECHDAQSLSGIFRDVLIYSLPKRVHISDFHWNVIMDSSTQIANIEIEVQLRWDEHWLTSQLDKRSNGKVSRFEGTYLSQLQSSWVVCASLYEEGVLVRSLYSPTSHSLYFDSSSATPAGTDSCLVPLPTLNAKNIYSYQEFSVASQFITVNCPTLWSAERPHVYTLVVSLKSVFDDTVVQAESCRIGFRNVDIQSGTLRVNTRPIVIRGVNYQEHDPVTGHSVSPQMLEADLQLMKRHSFNAIRTPYPMSSWFYELCSLYGFYVVSGANIDTRGMQPIVGKLADHAAWKKTHMLRLRRMVDRDKIHPSIIAWSIANESGYGAVHDAMADWLRKRDPSRGVLYEPASYGSRLVETQLSHASVVAAASNHGQHGAASKHMATDLLFPMYARISECITLANMNPDMPLVLATYAQMRGKNKWP